MQLVNFTNGVYELKHTRLYANCNFLEKENSNDKCNFLKVY